MTDDCRDEKIPRIALSVQALTVCLGQVHILKDLSLDVNAGRTLVVLGQSGCGKTTLLKAIAGLLPLERGNICLAGHDITLASVRDRGALYLDQEPLLFEHLPMFENIAFPMRMQKHSEADIRSAVGELLSAIELQDDSGKYPHQLSGGQKQRVAFARAILARPKLLLLDEPFGSLDSRTRGQMQTLFAELSSRFQLTSIFVTHDVKEALIVGDQFASMSPRLQLYPDRQSFMSDPASGVAEELAFWGRAAKGSKEVVEE